MDATIISPTQLKIKSSGPGAAAIIFNDEVVGTGPGTIRQSSPQLRDEMRAADELILYHETNFGQDVTVANMTYLIRNDGTVVHRWPGHLDTPEGSTAYLRADGLLVRSGAPGGWETLKEFPPGATGIVQLVDPEGRVVWGWHHYKENSCCLHHDICPLPNGNILVTAFEALTAAEAMALGLELDEDEPQGLLFWKDVIYEIQPDLIDGSTAIVWRWDSADHFIQTTDPNRPNFGAIAANPRKIDINYRCSGFPPFGIVINTIDYHPDRDEILLTVPGYGEIWVINHALSKEETAGPAGDLCFRFGNPAAYSLERVDEPSFINPSDATWIPTGYPGAGHILLHTDFDAPALSGESSQSVQLSKPLPAGVAVDPTSLPEWAKIQETRSRLLEIEPHMSEDGKYHIAKGRFSAKVCWESNPPSEFVLYESVARRSVNGHTTVSNSITREIFELTADRECVLALRLPGVGHIFKPLRLPANDPRLETIL